MIDENFQIYIVQISQKCIYEISTHFWHDLIIIPQFWTTFSINLPKKVCYVICHEKPVLRKAHL